MLRSFIIIHERGRSLFFSSLLRYESVVAAAGGLLVALLLCFASNAVPSSPKFALARRFVKGVALYGFYSVVVDRYATEKYAAMEAIPPPLLPLQQGRRVSSRVAAKSALSNEDAPNVTELRKTISRRSHLVEDPQDRYRWNQWALSPTPPATNLQTSSSKTETTPPNGTYLFAYRSYINKIEERSAIANSFYPIQRWFGVSFRRVGEMTIDGVNVSISDRFWIPHSFWRLACVPVTITWRGDIRSSGPLPLGRRNQKRIVWTETELRFPNRTIQSPPESERLRQEPWDIIKFEDGMLLLQRGDIGILAYDLVTDR